ncbi:coiled-coil domain-containing protein 73 isoform X3 [Paramormyrops kingsleyae]|nr:coiled-coil domain-containing protein 73 isoform X3 [Paramormyrops kingsleyae]XP_023671907.1 coiled-coil domain-containing protein 73 isoform X3 [Paramormyrops kingsleyae]XP_023671916.1 coiled-coil domain-containing protein 73 isoform X3 [Paramormyrops kingsleyae]
MSQESCIIKHEMDFHAETAKHVPEDKIGEEGFEYQLLLSYAPHELDQSDLAVQVIQFKASLLEAMEELRFHRQAEMDFEERISQLLLEKQELEWQKESFQHQTDMLLNQNTESVTALKKKFQARIKGLEEEKGKYQVTVELKDKEIRTLKEELKLLKLSKCSLQKTLSELEQKLYLQMQTKDSQLRQLKEVERRLEVVTHQCATVKEAHRKLEQSVGETVKLNNNLSALNYKHEATIKCLKQDMEKLNCEFVKFKVMSVCKSGEERSSVKDQKQWLHKLHLQAEMNKKLSEEVSAVRAEKQEVMKLFQQAQRLLQMQTEAVSRLELELIRQREDYQTLKREHELLQARTREKNDRFASLRGEYKSSKTKQEEDSIQDYISDQKDTSDDSSCETKNKESECELSQNGKELVQQYCPASTKEGPSDDNDEGRNPGPTRLKETVSDRLPQADYRVVIQAQDTTVYTSGHADIEGTGRGCCDADLACAALQPPECPARLARFPAKGPLSAHTADALGVGGGSTGQQAPDSQNLQLCMGKSHPGHSIFNENCVSSSFPCHEGDSISKLSDCSTPVAGDGEQIKEGGRQEQTKCIPVKREELTIIHSDINQKRTWALGFGTVEAAGIKRYPNENLGESLNSSDSCRPSDLSGEYYHGAISEENNTISDNHATVTADSHINPEESQTKLSDKSTHPQMGVKHAYGITEAGGSSDNSLTSIPEKHTSLNIMAENRHQYASLSNDTDITSGNTESKDGAPLCETEITTILSEPLKHDIKHNSAESDCSFFPRNKRFRSSFDLGVPEKWKWTQLVRNSFGSMMPLQGIQSNQEINISSAPVAASLSPEKIGFLLRCQGVPSPQAISEPVLQDKLNKKGNYYLHEEDTNGNGR